MSMGTPNTVSSMLSHAANATAATASTARFVLCRMALLASPMLRKAKSTVPARVQAFGWAHTPPRFLRLPELPVVCRRSPRLGSKREHPHHHACKRTALKPSCSVMFGLCSKSLLLTIECENHLDRQSVVDPRGSVLSIEP